MLSQDIYYEIPLKSQEIKTVEFANSIDPDEAAYNELPPVALHYLSSGFSVLSMI